MSVVDARTQPQLSFVEPSLVGDQVTAAVLVLHGGKVKSQRSARRSQLAVLRMRPFERSLAETGGSHGVAVVSVLNRVRGWNGPAESPVVDAVSAIRETRNRYGDVPVVLVGHSMGGRAALRAARVPGVCGVVALAPWLPDGEPDPALGGKDLVVIHGRNDRWTDPKQSRALVERMQGVARSAVFIDVRGDTHSMLRRASEWHSLTTGFALKMLGKESVVPLGANVWENTTAGTAHVVI